jgi:hypothetical protein
MDTESWAGGWGAAGVTSLTPVGAAATTGAVGGGTLLVATRLVGWPLGAQQALLALALIMLLRCVLDTWDNAYYLLPFLLALLAWETRAHPQRPPLLALSAAVLAWVSFSWLPSHASADAQSALFLAWTLPLATWMALRLARRGGTALAPGRSATRVPGGAWAPQGPTLSTGRPGTQEITVRALERPVRIS